MNRVTTLGTDRPPRWFDLLALAGPVAIASVGTVGLLLAIMGIYTGWLALALGGPVAAVMVLAAWRVLPRSPRGSLRDPRVGAAAAAVLLALGYLVFAGSVPSQNVIATRDPGLYLGTARWLSGEGDLGGEVQDPAFSGIEGLRFDAAGVYEVDDGEVEYQFNHLASVVMSVGYDLGGYRLLLRMPALASAMGLLALYAVTVRATRRPVLSLLAPTILAVSMPLLFVSRNTYSEPFAFALLWGAALALGGLHRRPRMAMALIGGFMLGALASTRVDALVYVILVFPLAALSIMAPAARPLRRARARGWLLVVASTAVVAVVGLIDLFEFSGDYADHLGSQLKMLRLAVLGSAVGSLVVLAVWRWVAPVHRLYRRVRRPAAAVVSALIVAVLAAGWLLRPSLQTVRGSYAYEPVRNIQRFEGAAIDATRLYAEDSLQWMAWYLGAPTLVAAILGLAVVAYLALRRGSVSPAALGVLVLTLAAGTLYWWQPSITPDHLWATRRFVPAVLPALTVMATVAVAAVWGMQRLDRRVRFGVVGLLALALVVPPAVTTWPLRWQRDQYGYLNPVLEACDLLPEDAAVVVLGGYGQATLPHTIRSWCEVPVAGQGDAVNAETVDEVAEQVARNGYRLTLLGADSNDLNSFLEVAEGEPQRTNSAEDHFLVQRTLDRPPDSYVDYERTLPVELPFRLHVLVVDVD